MKVMARGIEHDVDANDGRYAALYMRYYMPYARGCDTAEEAALFLNTGEGYGEMSSSGIYDTEAGVMLADKDKYCDCDYDWMTAIAVEVDVHVIDQ